MHQNNMLRRAHDVETSDCFDGGVVPEPGSMLLTAAGIGLAGYLKFRKKATV